jgi:hypothetical protein
MYINTTQVTGRHNLPSVLSKTALLTYFYNDGRYQDPEAISAVSIFRSSSNFYPSTVINYDGTIDINSSSLVLMNFSNSAALTSDSSFNVSNYAPGASGIYRLSEGVFAVVLDSAIQTFLFNLSGINEELPNTLSSVGDYIDVWTVLRAPGSDLDTVINEFTLNADRFYNTTERVLFRVATKMVNRHLILGSKVDLKFTNEINIENRNIGKELINIFRNSFVLNPQIEIYKSNSDRNLPSRVLVASFSDTSSLCDVTSDNTIVYSFDTSTLSSLPSFLNGTFGPLTGEYTARVKFSALNEVLYSNYFSFIVS